MRFTHYQAALALCACSLSVHLSADQTDEAAASTNTQTVELGGNRYEFPKYALVHYFGNPTPDAVEVNLRGSFWTRIFQKVAPLPDWMYFDSGVLGLHYITKPDDLFQWRLDRESPLPPVRGPVELIEARDGMNIWKSFDPEIAQEGLVYVTFEDRSEVYAKCTEKTLRSSAHTCDLLLFDNGILHRLGVPGNWLTHAPAAADEYLRLVKVR